MLLMIMTICPRRGNVMQRYTSVLTRPVDAVTGRGGGKGVSGLLVMNYRTNVNKPVSDPSTSIVKSPRQLLDIELGIYTFNNNLIIKT